MREMLSRYLAAHNLVSLEVREAAHLSNHSGYDVPVIYADITNTTQLMNSSSPLF
jgi:GDP-4-dehydro-6-deoxy-D-mannose reductase